MSGPCKWQHRFRQYVSRWTVPREAILNPLSRTTKHMTAKEIYADLFRMYPGMDLTTVYRTLDLMVRTGIINRFTSGDGQSRYEFKSDEKIEHHHHLTCIKCGKIIDYSDFVEEEMELVNKTQETLSSKYKFKVLGHNIEFYGLCDKCK